MAERALELMCRRALARIAVRQALSDQGVTRERIANARILIDQARFLVLNAADRMDKVGNKQAQARDRDDQGRRAQHGLPGGRLGDAGARRRRPSATTSPLAAMYAGARTLRFADGPDEVHRNQIAQVRTGAIHDGQGLIRQPPAPTDRGARGAPLSRLESTDAYSRPCRTCTCRSGLRTHPITCGCPRRTSTTTSRCRRCAFRTSRS